jgi:hypothetical protein
MRSRGGEGRREQRRELVVGVKQRRRKLRSRHLSFIVSLAPLLLTALSSSAVLFVFQPELS